VLEGWLPSAKVNAAATFKLIGNLLCKFMSSGACRERMMNSRTIGAKMKRLLVALFALSLAGCADKGNFARHESIKVASPTGHALSPTKSIPRKSLAARAEASDANESTNNASLMECGSAACKTQCAPEMDKKSRPKWCMYFKEPGQATELGPGT